MRRRNLPFVLAAFFFAAAFLPPGDASGEESALGPPQWINLSTGEGEVRLLWIKDPLFSAVRVMRRAEGKGTGFALVGESVGNTFIDKEAEGGTTYHYRLVGVDSSGKEGPPSRSRKVTVKVLTVKQVSPPRWEGYVLVAGGVGLKWETRPEEKVIAYNIYRREGPEGPFTLLGSTGRTRFRDTSLEAGKEYAYVLTALGADFRESSYSEEVSLLYVPKPEREEEEPVSWKVRRTRLVRIADGEKAALEWPVDVAVGAGSGNIYLSDSGRGMIVVFNQEGGLVRTLGEYKGGAFSFGKLAGFTLDRDETVYAVDSRGGAVNVVSPSDGSLKRRVVLPRGEGGGRGPIDVSMMGKDRLFVVDNTAAAVAVLQGEDEVMTIGGPGFEPGQFSAPTFCTTDGEGRFLLSDTMNGRIQIFDAAGEFVRSFGEYGQGLGRLARPKGIAVNGEGEIYVADSWQNVIQVFDGEGKFVAVLTDESGELLDLGSPNGIALDRYNRIYIAERLAGRLQVREILK